MVGLSLYLILSRHVVTNTPGNVKYESPKLTTRTKQHVTNVFGIVYGYVFQGDTVKVYLIRWIRVNECDINRK